MLIPEEVDKIDKIWLKREEHSKLLVVLLQRSIFSFFGSHQFIIKSIRVVNIATA